MQKVAKSFNLERPQEGQKIIALCEKDITILTYKSEYFSRVSCMSGHKPTHWIPFPALQDSLFLTVDQVATYFLCKARHDKINLHLLQLNRLVYIAQGISLAVNDTLLFDEQIEVWKYFYKYTQ